MQMIIGLGNPGKKYAETRHNVGFKVIDLLGGVLGIEVGRKGFGGQSGKGEYAGKQVVLLKPQQYMNLSGMPVAEAVGFYKLDLKDVLIVLDDMWLEPGQIRLRAKGAAGGHNGLADVIEKLGTQDVPRLRVGIGQAPPDGAVDFVLGQPDKKDAALVNEGINRAKDAAICWLEEGIEAAMTKFNRSIKDKFEKENS
jgi:PTH1 family peptidyl-tRNA hydrolase